MHCYRLSLVVVATLSFAVPVRADTAKPIYRIDSATAKVEKNRLVISASGAVRSGGWNNPRLRLKEISVPEGSTLRVVFLAVPPSPRQTVVNALLPVSARRVARLPRYGAKHVEIVAETNSVVVPIRR
jgi:hypothetical protein